MSAQVYNFQDGATEEKKANLINGIMGSATIVANALIIVVFVKDRTLRERYLYILRAFGDVLCGIYFTYGGFGRFKAMEGTDYYDLISPWECAMKFYATFEIVGMQLPVITTLMISIERVLAVQSPLWYNAHFTLFHRIGLLLSSIGLCLVSLLLYFITVWPLQQRSMPWRSCALTYSSSQAYNRAHEVCVTIIQIAAFCLSAFALVQVRRKLSAAAAMKKELQNVKPIFAVSLISLILVTLPQLYLICLGLFNTYINSIVLYFLLFLPCVNSFMNFFLYFWLTKEFRQEIIRIVRYRKVSNQTHALNDNNNVIVQKPIYIYPENDRSRRNQAAVTTRHDADTIN